jgi:REP element-mobilizing transposase RayT
VEGALKFFDRQRYELFCWCVMPNHVHALVQPIGSHQLSDIEHSWKSYTAHRANELLGRSGEFWQEECYDHLIRDDEDLSHAVDYILANPKAAGLENWRWVGLREDLASLITSVARASRP